MVVESGLQKDEREIEYFNVRISISGFEFGCVAEH